MKRRIEMLRSRRSMALILLVLLVYFCCLPVLLSDFPHSIIGRSIQQEASIAKLQSNQTLWESNRVTHYRITVKNQGYSSYWVICNSATLEVKDGILIGIQGAGQDTQWCPAVYSDLTVEGMFKLAQRYIYRSDPIRINIQSVEYDEDFGFISHLSINVSTTVWDRFFGYRDQRNEYFTIRLADLQTLN